MLGEKNFTRIEFFFPASHWAPLFLGLSDRTGVCCDSCFRVCFWIAWSILHAMSSVPAAFSPTNKIYLICSNTYPIPPTYIMFRWQQPFLLRLTNIIFKNVVLMYIVKIQLLQCLFTHGQIPSFLFGCQTDCEKSKNMSYCFSSMYTWLLGQTYTQTYSLSLIDCPFTSS